ncbi:hypothetical protein [Frigoribacterium sp. PhB24]|uniref:hypothetical protein n=1 Tax=Frigoribacterium sp. PhB24 TaxID=2485204 RepID=UPI000F479967|nr:hypothetical protein [Frigoribacterium sp. PhB24]
MSPAKAAPGETVTISSDDSCATAPPSGGWRVGAGHVGDGDPIATVSTTETFDGYFRATLALAVDFPTGESYVAVIDWDVGDCDDTASCAGPSDTFQVAE